MARISCELPNDLIQQLQKLNNGGADDMMDGMLNAAGDFVEGEIRNNARKVFKSADTVLSGLHRTKVYKTKSDDAKNVKIGFSGYRGKSKKTAQYPNGTPISLIAMAREYGTSSGEAKRPFFRTAFKKAKITDIMLKVQKKYIPED